jgi:hypothetical protein
VSLARCAVRGRRVRRSSGCAPSSGRAAS